jgi:hypothetical protein
MLSGMNRSQKRALAAKRRDAQYFTEDGVPLSPDQAFAATSSKRAVAPAGKSKTFALAEIVKTQEGIEKANEIVAKAERRQVEAVRKARADGFTWEQIGSVLGMTHQGAHKRFAALVESGQPTDHPPD